MTALNLLVLRVQDIEQSRAFYELLGLRFVPEQHGNGSAHYSATFNGVVLELYPATEKNPVSKSSRLGFNLGEQNVSKSQIEAAGGKLLNSESSSTVVADPNGIKIELSGCAI